MNNVIGRVVSCFWLTSGTERIKNNKYQKFTLCTEPVKAMAVLTLGKDNPFSESVKLNPQTDG